MKSHARRGTRRGPVQRVRLVRAVALICLAGLAMVVATGMSKTATDTVYRNFIDEMAGSPAAADGSASAEAIDALEDGFGMVPDLFGDSESDRASEATDVLAGECFDVGRYREVRVSENGTVIGLIGDGRAEEELRILEADMTGRGWVVASHGTGGLGTTFVKRTGRYRWAFASAVDVHETASVVVTLA